MFPRRVLIVEDHDLFRRTLRRFLESKYAGLEVTEAENGRHAIERCRMEPPDLVVMDIRMPECDGVEATREIKGLNESLPVVLYSADSLPAESRLCSESDAFIEKRFVFEKLPEEVARLLES